MAWLHSFGDGSTVDARIGTGLWSDPNDAKGPQLRPPAGIVAGELKPPKVLLGSLSTNATVTGAVFKLTAHRLMDWPALTLVGLNARLALVAGWDISMAWAGDNPDDKASRQAPNIATVPPSPPRARC